MSDRNGHDEESIAEGAEPAGLPRSGLARDILTARDEAESTSPSSSKA